MGLLIVHSSDTDHLKYHKTVFIFSLISEIIIELQSLKQHIHDQGSCDNLLIFKEVLSRLKILLLITSYDGIFVQYLKSCPKKVSYSWSFP